MTEMSGARGGGYKTYWVIWSFLLVLTVTMLLLDRAPISRFLFVVLMVGVMLTKAALIGGYFMHLRFERLALTLGVAVGLLVNGALLYVLVVPDARRGLAMLVE